jgi:hypothetical protein
LPSALLQSTLSLLIFSFTKELRYPQHRSEFVALFFPFRQSRLPASVELIKKASMCVCSFLSPKSCCTQHQSEFCCSFLSPKLRYQQHRNEFCCPFSFTEELLSFSFTEELLFLQHQRCSITYTVPFSYHTGERKLKTIPLPPPAPKPQLQQLLQRRWRRLLRRHQRPPTAAPPGSIRSRFSR